MKNNFLDSWTFAQSDMIFSIVMYYVRAIFDYLTLRKVLSFAGIIAGLWCYYTLSDRHLVVATVLSSAILTFVYYIGTRGIKTGWWTSPIVFGVIAILAPCLHMLYIGWVYSWWNSTLLFHLIVEFPTLPIAIVAIAVAIIHTARNRFSFAGAFTAAIGFLIVAVESTVFLNRLAMQDELHKAELFIEVAKSFDPQRFPSANVIEDGKIKLYNVAGNELEPFYFVTAEDGRHVGYHGGGELIGFTTAKFGNPYSRYYDERDPKYRNLLIYQRSDDTYRVCFIPESLFEQTLVVLRAYPRMYLD